MRRPHKLVAGVAAAALALGLGAGATAALPAAFAETTTPAAASDVPLTDAAHPDNVKMALQFLGQINNQVRGVERSTLTEQQIATAQGVEASQIQPGTGTGEILPPFKVNSDLTKWAQTRANELASAGMIDSHKNIWNGAPSWAIQTCMRPGGGAVTCSNMLSSPQYQSGTYSFGPENLAIASGIVTSYERYNPVWGWTDELNTGAQAYGHYLLEITKLGNVAGIGVARVTDGRFAGGIVTVLEVAYEAPGAQHGTTQTVEEALHQIAIANEIQSVETPAAVPVDSGTDPSPKFPETVIATYGDGHTADVPVTWATPDAAKYTARAGGTFTVHGTIDGYEPGVDITVNVAPATVTSVEQPKDVTITVGQSYTLPDTLNVTWSNGETTQAQPTWDTSAVKADTAGSYTATTTVEGKTITVKVTVVEAQITGVMAPGTVTVSAGTSTDGLKAKLPTTVQASYDNDTDGAVSVAWAEPTTEQRQTLASREGGSFTLHGTVDGWDKGVDVTVTVTKATATKAELSASEQTVTTPSGTAPTLAKDAKVTWSNGEATTETVTWPALTDAQKKIVASRDGGSFEITGTVEGTDLKATVTVKVEAATVTGVTAEPAEVQVVKGTKVSGLPKTVTVTYSNGDKEPTSVTWDTSAVKTDTVGTYTATATVAGQKVSLTVKVVDAVITSVTAPTGIEVPSGAEADDVPLPGTVKATWSNGSTSAVAVTWQPLTEKDKATLASREGGSLTTTGTVAGWDKPVTLAVTVTPAKAQTATLADQDKVVTTPSGTAPTLGQTATVTWSNGDKTSEPVTWNPINKAAYSARSGGSFQAQGTVAGLPVTVDVTVTPATPAKVKTSAIEVATKVGTAPELPATMTVVWSNGDESTESVTWDEVAPEQYAQAGSFEVAGTVNVRDAAVPATAGGAAVNPTLRIALRAAQAGEPVGTTFPVTAKVTVTDQVAPQPSDQPTDGASDAASDGGKDAATTAGTSVKRVVAALARTGASVVLLPVAAALVAAGALLIRRRRA